VKVDSHWFMLMAEPCVCLLFGENYEKLRNLARFIILATFMNCFILKLL
jgi:hypothetical protein